MQFFLLLLSVVYAQNQVDQDIRDGDAAFIKLKYADAIKFYTSAINQDPGNVRALYKRSSVYQQRKSFREAMSDLNEVIQNDPDYHLAIVARGKLNKDMGKFEQAKQDLQRVTGLKKASTSKAKAQKELDDIILVEEYYKNGLNFAENSNFEMAKEQLTKAIEKAPQWTLPRLARAKISFSTKSYADIIDDTLKILKVKNNDVDAMQMRAKAFRYLGELDSAEKIYQGCLTWDSSNVICKEAFQGLKRWRELLHSAEKRLENNLPKLAIQDIEQCLNYDPEWDFFKSKLISLKAKALLKQNNFNESLALCEEILAKEENSEVYIIKGDIYLAKENFDEAVRQYEKAVNLGDNKAQEKLRNAQKQQKMAARKDYYKILDLKKTASANEIKKAYRSKSFIYHPDKMKNASPEEKEAANKKMKDIGEAYAVLSDPDKKATYDRGDEFDNQGGGNPFYGFQGFQGFQGFNFKFN